MVGSFDGDVSWLLVGLGVAEAIDVCEFENSLVPYGILAGQLRHAWAPMFELDRALRNGMSSAEGLTGGVSALTHGGRDPRARRAGDAHGGGRGSCSGCPR